MAAYKMTEHRWPLVWLKGGGSIPFDHMMQCGQNLQFIDFRNTIYCLDEKWFATVRYVQKVWIFFDEGNVPTPKGEHKSWVQKISFPHWWGGPTNTQTGHAWINSLGVGPLCEDCICTTYFRESKCGNSRAVTSNHYWQRMEGLDGKESDSGRLIGHMGCKTHHNFTIERCHSLLYKVKLGRIFHELNPDGNSITLEFQPSSLLNLNVLDFSFFHSLHTKANKIKVSSRLDDVECSLYIVEYGLLVAPTFSSRTRGQWEHVDCLHYATCCTCCRVKQVLIHHCRLCLSLFHSFVQIGPIASGKGCSALHHLRTVCWT